MPSQSENALSRGAPTSPYAYLCDLAATLSTGVVDLPSFPPIVYRVRNALRDPAVSVQDVANLIRAEPILAGRILQMANAAAFNTTGRHVTNLDAALTRVGATRINNLVLAHAIRQLKDSAALRPIASKLTAIWNESVTVAYFCDVLARRTQMPPADAFVAGLLHGIGRLYILAQTLSPAAAGVTIDEELIDSWHPAIAKAVLENWGLEDALCDAVGAQQSDKPERGSPTLTHILVASIALARLLDEKREMSQPLSECAFRSIALNAHDCEQLLSAASRHILDLKRSMCG